AGMQDVQRLLTIVCLKALESFIREPLAHGFRGIDFVFDDEYEGFLFGAFRRLSGTDGTRFRRRSATEPLERMRTSKKGIYLTIDLMLETHAASFRHFQTGGPHQTRTVSHEPARPVPSPTITHICWREPATLEEFFIFLAASQQRDRESLRNLV